MQLFQFQVSSMKYGLLKPKNADIFEIKAPPPKKCTAQKSLRMCFLAFLDGQKNFDFFQNFEFFRDTL